MMLATAAGDIEHNLARLQVQQGDGASPQRRGEPRRCVVTRGMLAVAFDGTLVFAPNGHADSNGAAWRRE
jgi:hypothetical protein